MRSQPLHSLTQPFPARLLVRVLIEGGCAVGPSDLLLPAARTPGLLPCCCLRAAGLEDAVWRAAFQAAACFALASR